MVAVQRGMALAHSAIRQFFALSLSFPSLVTCAILFVSSTGTGGRGKSGVGVRIPGTAEAKLLPLPSAEAEAIFHST